jgi:predicted O-methyltransferase YrrM
LDRFLVQSLERHCASRRGQQQKQQRISPFALVEVGTYCGYSTIRIAHTILQWKQEQKQQQQQRQKVEAATAAGAADAQQDEISTIDFHIFTVDINPPTVAIARQLVSLAGLDAYVTFLLLPERKHGHDDDIDDDALSKTIQAALQEKYNTRTAVAASFVFLDHDKYKYLTDLKQLEKAKIIRGGQTSVAADNVIFHGLEDYRHHMQEYADRGIVETRLEMGQLEYTVVHRAVAAAADVVDDNDGGDAVFLSGTTTVTSRAALPGNKQRHLQTNADFRDGLELTYYLKDPY